ncbi:hypothetical protein [Candidatus Nitrosocosmicus franklandus]|uniref:HTH luxR-type domain-containing protein n=1 Tax=Candidatus Nitrosocosmicus franklandianus TaxID=1798806 RepID=A0A484I8U3_9ARCH|nr:hypothetical protein [Candidatus Nitrosocosmicus franklandus]VFJ14130.1 conserved protein of unknown function [Candidatus Nitrosocosmicus franklandus]
MISKDTEELIIRKYLQGYSRDEIAEQTLTATGTVTTKINEWKRRIGAPDIEDLRQFVIIIRKSGMTIKQLASSFRTLNFA